MVKNLTSCKLVDIHAKVLLQPHVDKVGLEAGNRVSQNGDEACIWQQPFHFPVFPFAATTKNVERKMGIQVEVWGEHLLNFTFLSLKL